jgi:predicted amidohydrolase
MPMVEELSLHLALWWRSRASAVFAHLARRAYPRPPFSPAVGAIRVAAVQMRPRRLRRAVDFADHAYDLVRDAVREGAELVVLPDHVTLPLLGLVPGLGASLAEHASLDDALAALAADGEAAEPEEAGVGIADVMTVATPAVRRVYHATFSTLARRFAVHIAAGSTMLAERDGRVLSVCHLYGPGGRLIATQAKTHLTALERRWGLGTGDDVVVADTALGRVALAGSMDALCFEPFRLFETQRADIALVSTAELGRPHPWRPMRGLWARVQESGLYGVQSALVGEVFGLTFGGTAVICAPLELSPAGDGILARAGADGEEAVVVADLDIAALRQFRRERGDRRNPEAIGRYLPELYTRPWPWPEEPPARPPHAPPLPPRAEM